jgi:hypothetical protein
MPWRRCRQRRTGRNVERAKQVERAQTVQRGLESLESRRLLSASAPTAAAFASAYDVTVQARPDLTVTPSTTTTATAMTGTSVSGYVPSQIRKAYGFDQVNFGSGAGDGAGQTIAIVTAYHDPNLTSDLHTFDQQFALKDPPALTVVDQNGGKNYPRTDGGWAVETALDVEWAHAIAPGAKILVVEASSPTLPDLLNAVDTARKAAGVSVVSMSWGADEFRQETGLDSSFTTPAGHTGVTFVAASGDEGAFLGPQWPATSPNVLSVGGTSLLLQDAAGAYGDESAWAGSGGGTSTVEPQPAWQTNAVGSLPTSPRSSHFGRDFQPFARWRDGASAGEDGFPAGDDHGFGPPGGAAWPGSPFGGDGPFGLHYTDGADQFAPAAISAVSAGRSSPDVAYNADPRTGFAVFSSVPIAGHSGWSVVGGTSAGAPQWAGLVAIANQGRAAAGLPALDGPSATIPMLYALYKGGTDAALNDITTGGGPWFVAAGQGYDQVTGLGTPKAPAVVAALGAIVIGGSQQIIVVKATPPPVAGPKIVFVPQPSGGSIGAGGTDGDGGYSSSAPAAPPHVPGHRTHPAAAQGPSDAGDPAPIPMSVAVAAAETLRPAVEAIAARAADAVTIVQTAVGNAVESNGAPGAIAAGTSDGAAIAHAITRGAGATGVALVGEMVVGKSPIVSDGGAEASPQLAEGAAVLAQTLARQATVLIHSIEFALQTPAEDAAASSDLVNLSLGPVRLLGLGSLGPEILSDTSDRLWRTTAAVSLAVTLIGYGYCKAKSDRRRAQLQQTLILGMASIVEVERPEEEM